ncbi:MAG: transposase [Proteobacteria bacterium]|nr:transposase [Pseudomonadota bacterium]MBU1738071.1 transposase [Pseudomonadota bacterium]
MISIGVNRFALRGKEKVCSQWLMYCMVHNIIEK